MKSADSIPVSRDIFAMDTYMNLKAYGKNADKAVDESVDRINELEGILSATSEKSEIWRINHADGGTSEVSDDTALLIDKAVKTGELTDGALDITLYPLLKEWGFTTGEYVLPESSRIVELLENVDYHNIRLNGNKVTLPKNYEIDLGALAKGYTGDEIMKIMKSHNIESAIINLGGNVQALGSKPDGSDWKVAVRNPFAPESDMCAVEVSSKAVITSGSYERFFTGSDGRNYWHILDPNDGYPADNGLVSVTVIGENGLECDSFSTALFVLGFEKSKEYIRDNPQNNVVLVTDDKKIYYTDGIAEKFHNISNMPAEVLAFE